MSVFRSYFKKNNTLIDNNLTNNSQNPVTEVSYGTFNKQPSRFILEIDFEDLQKRIADGLINPNRIVKHVLHMTNTISYAPQYLGKKSYSANIERASSFELDLFNVDEDWDEGSGYDFLYNDTIYPYVDVLDKQTIDPACNWYYRKTNVLWTNQGAYLTGETQIIGTQRFEKGNENLEIDVTDYINQRLFGIGYTGTSAFTGASYGLGVKFAEYIESGETEFRQAVAFHAKCTNTWYEPYIETIIDDRIVDDRNYFYLDKDNELYLYVNVGNTKDYTVSVDKVEIYDNHGALVDTISGITGVTGISKGIYKINYKVESLYDNGRLLNDAILYEDKWYITINGRETTHIGEFYLISSDKYYTFDQSNQINIDNYFFYFWGIAEKENIVAGVIKKIKLTIKELYANQNNFLPLDIEYRLFTTVGKKYEIDVIPFTSVNRTNTGYEFNLDTSWLIPQDYFLQIRMKNGNYYENKQTLSFTVVSDGILKP
jgi:hypothetical protein